MDKFAHELEPGDECTPLKFVVSPELNQQYLFALEDFDARYIARSASKPAEVHPALLLAMSSNTKSPGFRLAPGTGSIGTEDVVEFLAPAHVGRNLHVTFRVAETYEKRGRDYQVMECAVADEDGTAILRRAIHVTFFKRKAKP
jgi:hypothetical protein